VKKKQPQVTQELDIYFSSSNGENDGEEIEEGNTMVEDSNLRDM
jgi:hypothetical protein